MQQQLYTVVTADHPYDPVFVLGPPGRATDLRGIAARQTVGALIKDELEAAGFSVMEPEPVVFEPMAPHWHGARVRFPEDAPHIYAGRELRVDSAFDGLPVLVDPETQLLLMADDMPWQASEPRTMTGGLLVTPAYPFEQIPLGPLQVPEQQFAREEDLQDFKRALRVSGYVVDLQQGDQSE
jgi:hypothetical protein